MTAEELRHIASQIASGDSFYFDDAADYLRACADALDAGPAAQVVDVLFDGAQKPAYKALRVLTENEMPDGQLLYPLAMPAPLRLPEPMTDAEIQLATENAHWTQDIARAIEAEVLRRVKEVNAEFNGADRRPLE